MSDNSTVGKIAVIGGLAAAAIAIYNWLKNSECNTPGSSFYGSSVCGWLGLSTATASSTAYPLSTAYLNSLSASEVNATYITGVLQQAAAGGISDAQLLPLLQAKFATFSSCPSGQWNSSNATCAAPVLTSVPVLQSNQPPPTTTPAPSSPATLSTLGQQIQTAAGGASSLTMDQWNYYYNQILANRGQAAVSGTVFEAMLAAAGLSDATRSTAVPLSTFLAALSSQGLSGMGSPYSAYWVPAGMLHSPGVS